jgi:hypothetical protein
MTKEGFVKRAVEDLLKAERIRYIRTNAGDRFGSTNGRKWRIRGHAKGTPDFLLLPFVYTHLDPPHPLTRKAVVWCEVKAPGKSPTAEQLQFADAARNDGETWLCVDDVAKLQAWIKENRAR